jgi:hypothetical protein
MFFRNRPQDIENKPSRPLRQFKLYAARVVVKWVTISEFRVLIVFAFLPYPQLQWNFLSRPRQCKGLMVDHGSMAGTTSFDSFTRGNKTLL